MNERDYLIFEAMILAGGSLVVTTIVSMMIIFNIMVSMGVVVVLAFVGFCTFFFGLYCHMRRRIFVLEMQALATDHSDPEKPSGSER